MDEQKIRNINGGTLYGYEIPSPNQRLDPSKPRESQSLTQIQRLPQSSEYRICLCLKSIIRSTLHCWLYVCCVTIHSQGLILDQINNRLIRLLSQNAHFAHKTCPLCSFTRGRFVKSVRLFLGVLGGVVLGVLFNNKTTQTFCRVTLGVLGKKWRSV